MGFCKKCMVKTALSRAVFPLAIAAALLLLALYLPSMEKEMNEIYRQQAEALGVKQAFYADSGSASLVLAAISLGLVGLGLVPLSKLWRPQNSRMGKSILRYARFQGEGDLQSLLEEVEADVAHAPRFGDVVVGARWIAGRSFPSGGMALRLASLCGVYHLEKRISRQGASGMRLHAKWCYLFLLDSQGRETILVATAHGQMDAVYDMLLRHNPALLHGSYDDYLEFLSRNEQARELALLAVAGKMQEQARRQSQAST